jgi:hypothetical protein
MRVATNSHPSSRTLPLPRAATRRCHCPCLAPAPVSSEPQCPRPPSSTRPRLRWPPPSTSSHHALPHPLSVHRTHRAPPPAAASSGLLHPPPHRPSSPYTVQLNLCPTRLSRPLRPTPKPPPSGRHLAPTPPRSGRHSAPALPPSSRRPILGESRASPTRCTWPPPRRCPFPLVSPPCRPLPDANVICGIVISPGTQKLEYFLMQLSSEVFTVLMC